LVFVIWQLLVGTWYLVFGIPETMSMQLCHLSAGGAA
jgi:hypothetical protein